MREISSTDVLRTHLAAPPVVGAEVAILSLSLTRADVEQLLRRGPTGVYLFGCDADPADLERLLRLDQPLCLRFVATPLSWEMIPLDR